MGRKMQSQLQKGNEKRGKSKSPQLLASSLFLLPFSLFLLLFPFAFFPAHCFPPSPHLPCITSPGRE